MSPHTTPPAPSTTLVNLAPELLELVLSYLGPLDLTRFGAACRRAHAFVAPDNQVLWKAAFLQHFDNPRHVWDALTPTARAAIQPRESEWDWFREARRRCTALNAVRDMNTAKLLTHPEAAVTALLDLLETASRSGAADGLSLNIAHLNRLFTHAPYAERIVHDYHRDINSMSLPIELDNDSDRPVTRSMLSQRIAIPDWASRFHIFYGMTEREQESVQAKAAARALVYNMAVTGPQAEYGPFLKDNSGHVNWQAVEAISSLMHRIFATALNAYHVTPSGFATNLPYLVPLNPAAPADWAGVTGNWVGTYAFLDYRALVHYNFANDIEYPLDLGHHDEACGDLMRLELRLNETSELRSDARLRTDLPYCHDLPVLYFTGTSNGRLTGRPAILVRGTARLVPNGRQVRWRIIIRYAGSDQWQLEGVQPGGVRTGGMYGIWSHVDHDEHGPMGPFYYAPADICHGSSD